MRRNSQRLFDHIQLLVLATVLQIEITETIIVKINSKIYRRASCALDVYGISRLLLFKVQQWIVLQIFVPLERLCDSMFFSPLLNSAYPPCSCVLTLLNFLFLRRDFFLLVVFFDFNLSWPTLLDFLVGHKTLFVKSTLSNRLVSKLTWLRIQWPGKLT